MATIIDALRWIQLNFGKEDMTVIVLVLRKILLALHCNFVCLYKKCTDRYKHTNMALQNNRPNISYRNQ